MDFQEYVKPELLILIPVLYLIGKGLKASKFNDCKIPAMLGLIGICLCILWVTATTPFVSVQSVSMGLFVAITQGILAAGASVYGHQLKHQRQKGR